jgi:hypothetical protein
MDGGATASSGRRLRVSKECVEGVETCGSTVFLLGGGGRLEKLECGGAAEEECPVGVDVAVWVALVRCLMGCEQWLFEELGDLRETYTQRWTQEDCQSVVVCPSFQSR